MKRLVSVLIHGDTGQDLIEYAFLAVFIALAVVIGLGSLSTGLSAGFSNISTQLGPGS